MPTGVRLTDGHPTTFTMSAATGAALWEKEITPIGGDGGGANDTTTMRNTAWRTKQPKKLVSLTDMTGTAAYDPAFYDTMVSVLNVNQVITVDFPDGSSVSFYGWLNEFKPNSHKEGEQPTVNFTFIASNQTATGAEVGPEYTAGP